MDAVKRAALARAIDEHEAAIAAHEACLYTHSEAEKMLADLKAQRANYVDLDGQLAAERANNMRAAIGGAALKFEPSAALAEALAEQLALEEKIDAATKAVETLKSDADHASLKVSRLAELREFAAEEVVISEMDARAKDFLETLAHLQTEYRTIEAFARLMVKDASTMSERNGGLYRTVRVSQSTRDVLYNSGVISGQEMFVTNAYRERFTTEANTVWNSLRKDPTATI